MNCLQCANEATETGTFGDYKIRECAAGHRTALLTAKQEKEIAARIGAAVDENGNVTFEAGKKMKRKPAKAKGIPATMYDIFDKVSNEVQ